MLVAASAARTGTFTSAPYRVSDTLRGKVQIVLNVAAAQRTRNTRSCTATVELLRGAQWMPICRFTWTGNTKAVRAGWPTEGPAVRIPTHDPLLDPQTGTQVGEVAVLPGKDIRVSVTGGLTYAIDITERPE